MSIYRNLTTGRGRIAAASADNETLAEIIRLRRSADEEADPVARLDILRRGKELCLETHMKKGDLEELRDRARGAVLLDCTGVLPDSLPAMETVIPMP